MKSLYIIICLSIASLLTGCGTGPAIGTSTGTVSVTILGDEGAEAGEVSVAVRVSVNASFTATFTAPVNSSTVNASTFYITPKSNANMSAKDSNVSLDTSEATISCSSNELSCTLSQTLEYDTSYYLIITSGIQFREPNLYGFFSGLTQEFLTEEADLDNVDETAPVVGDGTITTSDATTTQMDLSWSAATDDVSDDADLLYKVYYSATADLDSVADIEENGTAFGDYTADMRSTTVTGLIQNTAYTFNVIVKDEAGNQSIYDPADGTTLRDTTGAPAISDGSITAENAAMTSVDLEWTAATDEYDAAGDLEYSVFYSLSNNLDSVTNIGTYGTEFGTATAGLVNVTVTGLDTGETYYFNVIVEDSDGNQRNYTTVSEDTLGDTISPTVGTGITFSNASPVGTLVSWGAASDVVSEADDLQYKVVRADTSAEIDSVVEADAISGYDLIMNWTAATTSDYAFVEYQTSPYFAVLVKDEAGNKEIYTPVQTASAIPDSNKKGLIPLSDGSIIVMYMDNADNRYLKSIVFDSDGDYVNGPTLVDDVGVGEGQHEVGGKISGLELSDGNIVVAYSGDSHDWWNGYIGPGYYIRINSDGEAVSSRYQFQSDGDSEFISMLEVGAGDILLLSSIVTGTSGWYGWTSQAARAYAYDPISNTSLHSGVMDSNVTLGLAGCSVGNEGDVLVLTSNHVVIQNSNYSYYRTYDESGSSMGAPTYYATGLATGARCVTLENANKDALVLYVDIDDNRKGKMFTIDGNTGVKSSVTTFQDTYQMLTDWSDILSAFIIQNGDLAGNIFVAFVDTDGGGTPIRKGYYMVIDADGDTVTSPTLFRTDALSEFDIMAGELSGGRVAIIYKNGLRIVTPEAD